MENDLSLPPNRPRPKGSNKRKKPKAENRPRRQATAAQESGGLSTTLVVGAIGVGLLLAYLSTTEASGNAGTDELAPLPVPIGAGTPNAPEPVIQTGPVPATKPTRRPLSLATRPLVFVYVNSFNGESVFDRLKTNASLIDDHGLDRVTRLLNREFAGVYTGKFWAGTKRADGTTPTYLQLYVVIDKRPYNYWVDASQVKQFHGPGAQQHELSGAGMMMTAETKRLITGWYAARYA